MAKIILAGFLGIYIGWAVTSFSWKDRCLIQNARFDEMISLAGDNYNCIIRNNLIVGK